ncbi:MAG: translocation/assembly module TamB domain-containing protein [Gemmatimonadota bacterium]
MNPAAFRKAGLVLAGVVMGLLGLAVGFWFYLQAARIDEVRSAIGERLQIARTAIEDVEILEETAIRVVVRDVTLFDDAGDAIVRAPRVALTLDATTLEGDGAIEFYDVVLSEPDARFVQSPGGEWNIFRAMGLTADGEPLEAEEGRPLLFRDVEIDDGTVLVAIPTEGAPPEETQFAMNLPRTTIGGLPYQVYTATGVQARLPTFLVGGEAGWRAEVAALSGDLEQPDMRIDQVEGVVEQEGEDGIRFDLAALRFGESAISGSGSIRFAEDHLLYDVQLRTESLQFADLRPLLPNLEADGSASFALDVESLSAERLRLDFTELDVTSTGSTVRGSVAIAIGGEQPLGLLDADVDLAPLQLGTLAQLGLVENLPLLGDVTGNVTTVGAPEGFATVDITATVVPSDDPTIAPSVLLASGQVALGGPDDPLRLDGLSLGAQPLYLASLRSFAPEQAEQLRGELRGTLALAGTTQDVRISGGTLAYDVGDATTTTFTDVSGRLVTVPELRYELSATAQPLALASIRELFPALPIRSATLSGPLEISGDASDATFSANLSGAAGGIRVAGGLILGEPLRFDIDGSVRAFSAGMILRPEVPVEGPLTGSFSVAGTPEQFAFDVDFTQVVGRFALAGTASLTGEQPRFDVSGDVADFRLGTLIGSPELFPDPMTGSIELAGGDGAPYVFDIDLTGAVGRLDLAGFYDAGAVPTYEASGQIAGLDVSRLPIGPELPQTNLTGFIDVRGSGVKTETIRGEFAFDVTRSTVADMELSAALGQIRIESGVMTVDTLHVQLDDTRLTAEGSWGLTTPANETLRYSFASPDLSELNRLIAPGQLIPPRIEGSVSAEGEVGGSFENPVIETRLVGQALRYEDWRADDLSLDADVQRDPLVGWSGQFALDTGTLVVPRIENFESVRLEASGNESSVSLGLFARRDAESDVALSGVLELEGMFPRGIGLQTMALRLDGAQWTLLDPARLHYTPSEGLTVENLALQREGEEQGTVAIDGTIPPEGIADLAIDVTNFDLGDLQLVSAAAPAIQGLVTMNAVLSGPVTNPELTLQARLRDVEYEGVNTDLISVDALYSGQQLTGTADAVIGEQRLFFAELSVPMNLSLADMLPSFELLSTEPLSVSLVADSVPVGLVTAAVPGLIDGTGVARAQLEVSGTIESPALEGWARLDDGAFTSDATGARYTAINADLELAGNRIVVSDVSAVSGGTAVATGTVDFIQGAAPRLSLSANFTEFGVMNDPAVAELIASGEIAINGPLTAPVVTGRVRISESTFQVPELGAEQPGLDLAYMDVAQLAPAPQAGLGAVAPMMGNVRIDGVEVTVDESVWLESDEMRVQIGGDVVLFRTGDELRIFGSLQAVRGTYALEISSIVREFDVISGRVQFFGTGDLNPSLDIVAGYRVRSSTIGSGGDITILVQVTGTLLSPRLQLAAETSVPLSEADLISYLLFGQPSFELGGVNRAFAEQLLVQEFVGGFLASELERPILRAGICDWVRVRPGATTSFQGLVGGGPFQGAVIECGWELASDFFLTGQTSIGGLFGGGFADWRLGVEWQIDDQWMWEASYGSVLRDPAFGILDETRALQFSTDIRRQWEYGLPREESPIDLTPTESLPGDESPPLPTTPSIFDNLE